MVNAVWQTPEMKDQIARQVQLEKLRFQVITRISEELASDLANPPTAKIVTDHLAGSICFQARFTILGHEMERIEVRYPEDWWQAFKERWFPQWALRRWPVKEEVVELVARELYPKVKLPDKEPVIALKYE